MRHSRIKADGAGYYHGMSRIIEKCMILGETEKERILKLMFNLAAFGDLSILAYCIMTNHFHVLIHVPQRKDVTDDVSLQGFTPEQIQAVVKADGRLPLQEVLRCRVRYFSDGLVLGSQAFVDSIFDRYRSQFGSNRKSGARPLRFGDWPGLCSLRDLRLLPISKS